ncbi:MAG: nuclear transport factor 2 family protein [Gammaproteobacteria bacterium]|nr:nuclear transport factor 2 family protein [Gammaproteobacteria bacterium]MCP5146442.1 nuclear transport factor 2 family protein [Gammaproteobacteria bacterium]
MRILINAAVAFTLLFCVLPADARNPTAQERADIESLAYHYIFALDWRDGEAYAATFAPDGVLNYGGGQAVGREAIAAMVNSIREREMAQLKPGETGQGNAHNQHFVTSMVIDISTDGGRAVSQAYWMAVRGTPPVVNSYGHYVDELVRINGEWFYASRRTFNEQAAGRGTQPYINPVTHPAQYGIAPLD